MLLREEETTPPEEGKKRPAVNSALAEGRKPSAL